MITTTRLLLLAFLCLLFGGGEKNTKAMFVSHKNEILELVKSSSSPVVVVSSDLPIVAFDIHQFWRQIIWATDYHIYRTPLYDLQSTTEIAATGEVGGLAVDWVHHQVYWLDTTISRLEASHLDGTARRIVYEAEWPVSSLVVDPELGKLFWLESSQVGSRMKRIKSCNLYGSHIKTIYGDSNIYELSPLAINVIKKNVYFYKVNGSFSEQWAVNYSEIKYAVKLFEKEEPVPRSLDIHVNGFFYSNRDGLISGTWKSKGSYTVIYDNTNRSLSRVALHCNIVDKSLSEATQIRLVGKTKPRWQDQECRFHVCQHECVPSSGEDHPTCACGYGYTLLDDKKSCSENGYVLYATGNTFGRLTMDGDEHTILYNDSSSKIQAFDVHVKSGYIYWSDLHSSAIYRAPAGAPTRKHVVVPDVSAYGVTVDWVYGHLYWSDHSRIMVARLDGTSPMAVIEDVDAPADMVVDPINRYIFWAECGHSLSLRRAGLSGDNVTELVSQVTCGVSLLADPNDRTLYWLDWAGDVFSCNYDDSQVTRHYVGMARAIVVLTQRLLWVPWEHEAIRYTSNGDTDYHTHIDLTSHDVKLTSLKAMYSPTQPTAPNECEDSDCPGLCLPSREPTVPFCACADENEKAVFCTHYFNTTFKSEALRKPWLEVVDTSPFTIILRRSGTLRTHAFREFSVNITEVDSLVDRHSVPKISRIVHVDNETFFYIDSLNPATSYSLTVPNRVTRGAFSLVVHTAPPSLAVRRLPIVTVPGVAAPLRWHQQNIHYFSPNAWEDLVTREYVLLLISEKEYFQSNVVSIKQPIMQKLKEETNGTFTILRHYNSEQFDDDPEMYLANIPWGEVFSVAMVQVTEYKQVYNLDYIYSQWFRLPDPNWKHLLEDTLKEYRHKLIYK